MTNGFNVERRRLERYVAALDEKRAEWNRKIPEELSKLYTSGDEFTVPGIETAQAFESLRAKYANDIVPGISTLMAEVVAALHSVKKNYGDAEEASTVAQQGDRLPQHQTHGNDLGDILNQGVR